MYRYSALMDRLEGRDPNALTQGYTDIVPRSESVSDTSTSGSRVSSIAFGSGGGTACMPSPLATFGELVGDVRELATTRCRTAAT